MTSSMFELREGKPTPLGGRPRGRRRRRGWPAAGVAPVRVAELGADALAGDGALAVDALAGRWGCAGQAAAAGAEHALQ
jgi:hypothetical protein